MAAQTHQRFDFGHLKRSMESWDVEALLDLYADDFEQVEMDDATPPAEPRVRRKSDMAAIFQHCHDAAVKIGLDNPVVDEDRLACTITCYFDGGRRVVANSIMDLRDGKIVRQLDVQARDA
jgi:ketosteroid isomerase-like protein